MRERSISIKPEGIRDKSYVIYFQSFFSKNKNMTEIWAVGAAKQKEACE